MAGSAPTTRDAILAAAMRGFSEKGVAATSTREIAAGAGTNVASIAYHFGGKNGLRAACARRVVDRLGVVLAAEGGAGGPSEARLTLADMVQRMSRFLSLDPEARLVAGFIMREMSEPSAALDLIYEGVFEPVHRRACALWSAATGRPAESEEVRLAVFAMIGQIVYFHIGRPVVERRMGWAAIGPAEALAIAATLQRNLLARLDADSPP
jgi:TetR/AcrR family transcriptional regulator, regulator of cefoperazone and chloramphenicol sensitivity